MIVLTDNIILEVLLQDHIDQFKQAASVLDRLDSYTVHNTIY